MDKAEDRARFGAWLVGKREARGYDQKAFILHSGVSKATVSAVENGKAGKISQRMIKRLAVAAGASELEALVVAGMLPLDGLTLESLEWARDLHGLPEDLRSIVLATTRQAKSIAGRREIRDTP